MAPTDHPAAPVTDTSDGSLLRRFRGGGNDAATLLYFRYADHLRSLAEARLPGDVGRRLAPSDIVQSVFRTFFRRAALGQYDVPEGEDLWKLLLVIALNKLRNAGAHHRAACRDVGRTPGVAVEDAGAEAGDEDAWNTLRLVVEDLLQRLPPPHRAVVEGRIEGREVAELAEMVGRSKRSVERVLRDFRERLQAALEED
jgi:RNA polymerase sigma-70 factor (ECF subfamily)